MVQTMLTCNNSCEIYTDENMELFPLYEIRNEYNQLHSMNDHPCAELSNGTLFWCKFGKLHRDVGPAIIWSNHSEDYYVDGVKL